MQVSKIASLASEHFYLLTSPHESYSYSQVLSVSKAMVIELHCCPKSIKNTSVSHSVALDGMFLHDKIAGLQPRRLIAIKYNHVVLFSQHWKI